VATGGSDADNPGCGSEDSGDHHDEVATDSYHRWEQDVALLAGLGVTAYRFADYAATIGERLADRIGLWITLNEPFVVTAMGYALGIHAPGKALMLDGRAGGGAR
jgi:beta-glucosidase/6-phospho-beta-glucosidase/beta-galactosidase